MRNIIFVKKKQSNRAPKPDPADPLGSYTGVSDQPDTQPEQDVDDL